MAKINDTTTYPNTPPALDDHVIGTDVSDTANSADGESVTFKYSDVADLFALQHTWHPYNRVIAAGTQDGVIYDSAVDGTVASVESPDFEAGYEYMFYFDQVTGTSGATLQFQMYRDDTAAYESITAVTGITVTVGQGIWGGVTIPKPKFSRYVHELVADLRINQSTGGGDHVTLTNGYRVSARWTNGKVKFLWSAGSINNGKIYMFRRREGISA